MFLLKSYLYLLLLLIYVNAIYAHNNNNNIENSAYCTFNETNVVNTTVQRRVTEMQRKFSFSSFRIKNVPVEKVIDEIVPHTSIRKVVRCCDGYIRQVITGICVPQCDTACTENADCVQPNKCQCLEGYTPHILNDQLTCVQEIQSTSDSSSSTLMDDTSTETSREFNIPSTTSRVSARTLIVDCQINGCPNNADCQYNNTCACWPGYEWREIITKDSNEDSLCLPIIDVMNIMDGTTSTTTTTISWTFKYIIILIFILGVVLCAMLLVKIIRIVLVRRSDKHILNKGEDKQNDKNMLCKYVPNDKESPAILVY